MVTLGDFDSEVQDHETLEDGSGPIDESKVDIDFENCTSKSEILFHRNVVDVNIKEEVSLDLETPHVNIEKFDESKEFLQFEEIIKTEISDDGVLLVKGEPQTSEQSNDSYDAIRTAVNGPPKRELPIIKYWSDETLVEESTSRKNVPEKHQVVTVPGKKTRYNCNVCDKSFAKQIYLNQHSKFHSGVNLYECYDCQKKFIKKAILEIHVRKHMQVKQFECERCKQRFKHWQSIRKHQLKTCGRSTVQCEFCSKVVHKRVLKNHMKFHQRPEFYKCETCDKSFSKMSLLKRHVRTHTGETTAQCEICSATFHEMTALISHMRIHSGKRPFICELCGSAFNLSSNLRRHMKVHSDDRPFKCDICGQKYKELQSLNNHKLRHSNTRQFSCNLCDKAFFSKAQLNGHTRTHTGEKPFDCNICKRNFTSKNYLRDHIRLHANPTSRFVCDICNTKIKYRLDFIRHVKAHEFKKTYPCDVCGQNLSSNYYLKRHRKLHFSDKAFQCQCGEHFIVKDKVKRHLEKYPDHKLEKGILDDPKNKSTESL